MWIGPNPEGVLRKSVPAAVRALGDLLGQVARESVHDPKAGLIGLTRDLAQQWTGRRGIRVNAVAPGDFASEMSATIPEDRLLEYVRSAGPIGRLGEQRELDAAVLFLASDASSYVTGTTLSADGGAYTR